jgi:uncharacterized metal-binding protein YceD (DUF177 family)
MIFPIKQILPGHSVLTQDVAMTETQTEEAHFTGVVHCRAEIEQFTFQIIARISYSCCVFMECARCTKAYEQPVNGVFSVVLQQTSTRGDTPDAEDDSVDLYFSEEDDEIDLRPVLFDEIMTSVPMKPLCTPQCLGFQMDAGTLADADKGSIAETTIDPRWEALRKLKK